MSRSDKMPLALVHYVDGASFYLEDCRVILGHHKADLIFADPPFNNGSPYSDWNDNLDQADYVKFSQEWMDAAYAALSETGSIWVNIDDHQVHHLRLILDKKFHFVNHVIWNYRFGPNTTSRFVPCKSHLLWYSKSEVFKFRPERIKVKSVRQEINDPRAMPGGKVPGDVWGLEENWGRVQGNNKEKIGAAPNQLPEKLLERIILSCSDEGDMVMDPFCGNGTTAVVAHALKRQVVTGDVSIASVDASFERLLRGPIHVQPD